jgi:predicted oxidoreductase
MQTLALGRSELRTSRLAYGCWRIAKTNDPATDYRTGREAIIAASRPVTPSSTTRISTARVEPRRSSARCCRELRGDRDHIVIASKCGIRFQGDPLADSPYRYDSTRDYIILQVEHSLRRLKVECIDVYQLHRPDLLMEPHEVADAFVRLLDAGKVREFGVSNFSPSQLTLLQTALPRPLVVNQIEISLCQFGPFTTGTLDQCQQLQITPLAWSPLGGGLLADGASDILRHQRSYRVADLIKALDEVALSRGTTRDVVALAWLLRHPAGIVPIIGSTRPERIKAAAKAASFTLTREEWYRLLVAALGEPLA